ncbi:hypothetical protein, partial [Pseudomonas koreensis]|uniref:hypothetical protein n=1 Tax=Pseudomonas koreensis TaxID=198620 RepID=UPI001E5D5EEB
HQVQTGDAISHALPKKLKTETDEPLKSLVCARISIRDSSHCPYRFSSAADPGRGPHELLLMGGLCASKSASVSLKLSAQMPLLGFNLLSAFHKRSSACSIFIYLTIRVGESTETHPIPISC